MSEKTNNVPQQPVEPVREYFSKDVIDRMSAMSLNEMASILKELPDSQFWIAILKYNQQRLGLSQSALFSGDPFKDPTGVARNQGILLGLSDLQNAVINLISNKNDSGELRDQITEEMGE
jgi:hypothetical protein